MLGLSQMRSGRLPAGLRSNPPSVRQLAAMDTHETRRTRVSPDARFNV